MLNVELKNVEWKPARAHGAASIQHSIFNIPPFGLRPPLALNVRSYPRALCLSRRFGHAPCSSASAEVTTNAFDTGDHPADRVAAGPRGLSRHGMVHPRFDRCGDHHVHPALCARAIRLT